MWEIPAVHAKNWAKVEGVSPEQHAPKNLDVECPTPTCRRSLVNIQLTWKSIAAFLHTSCSCVGCNKRTQLFLMNAPKKDVGSGGFHDARLFQFPKPSVQGPFEDEIVETSPSFVEIHSQAQESEGLGLNTLVGIGFRKALEFLIKDYLISKRPNEKEAISRANLSQCINKYVPDPNIKMCAERATWLGNDETHYVRTWPDNDLKDLKRLIKLTQYWISSEFLTLRYGSEMAKRKQP
jgi:hypothetical protein